MSIFVTRHVVLLLHKCMIMLVLTIILKSVEKLRDSQITHETLLGGGETLRNCVASSFGVSYSYISVDVEVFSEWRHLLFRRILQKATCVIIHNASMDVTL